MECAVKGTAFLWVRIPPGICRSGRKQSEQPNKEGEAEELSGVEGHLG
jgi:hypothetical protein